MELELSLYRAAMVEKRYQAQMKCRACGSWVLTKNLEVYKDKDGVRVADAENVICEQTGCGENMGHVVFKDWPYSAPVKWRKTIKREADADPS